MSIMATVTILVPDMIIPFGIGVFCTSLGDGFAGLFGQLMSFPKNAKIYGNKTIYGTIFNFITCFIVIGVFNREFSLGLSAVYIPLIALFVTELELFTSRGLDNITVTLGAAFLSYFIVNFTVADNYLLPIMLTPAFVAFAYKKRALTVGGIFAALIVDIVISVSLGNFGFAMLAAFFVGGLITDKIKKSRSKSKQKPKNGSVGHRNHIQVLANSLVPSLAALLYAITESKVFIIAFVASFAEALADTSASGIGMLSGKAYDIFKLKSCPPGISGGMSIIGTVASAISAVVISFLAASFSRLNSAELCVVSLSAFLGAFFDSLLGSLIQVKYVCEKCGTLVESKVHCDTSTVRFCGVSFVDNNVVNFISTLFSAFVSSLIYFIL